MTQTATVRQASQELQQDHAQLHALIDGLAQAGDLAALAGKLAALHERLTRHFTEEEKPGGLYDSLGVCQAAFRAPLAELVDDHFRIAAALHDLRQRAQAAGGSDADALRSDVSGLVRSLAEHEQRELAMVQQAVAREA